MLLPAQMRAFATDPAARTLTTRRLVLAVIVALGIAVVQVGWRTPTAGPATYGVRPFGGASRSTGATGGGATATFGGPSAAAVDGLRPGDLAGNLPAPLARDVVRLRDAPARHVADPRDAAIVAGVAFGRTDGIDAGDKQAFLTSGLWHLLAASGQNVALVAMLCLGGAWLFGLGRIAGTTLALVAVPTYVVVTGGGASIERAGIMGELALLAWLAGSLFDVVDAMLVAAALLVWIEPGIEGGLGFQLSFACVAALLAWCTRITDWLRAQGCPARVAEGTAATVACSAATAPILLHATGAAPVGGAVANLACVPMAGALLVTALGSSLVEGVLPDAAGAGFTVCGWLAHGLRTGGHVAAALPLASVHSWPALLATYGVAAAAVVAIERLAGALARARARRQLHAIDGLLDEAGADCGDDLDDVVDADLAVGRGRRIRIRMRTAVRRWWRAWRGRLVVGAIGVLLVALAAGAGVVQARRHAVPPVAAGVLRVSSLDVGQGDATLLQVRGHAVLVDTGPPTADIVATLRARGVSHLDGVVGTHFESDHIGNLERIAAAEHPAWVAWPRTGPGPWGQLRLGAARSTPVCAGTTRTLGPASIRVVHPACDRVTHRTGDDYNDNAVVLVVSVGTQRVLLTADAESPDIGAIDVGHVDLLKVAHHGSADPGLPAWLARLGNPGVALVSVGARNTYGHPAPATLDALAAAGAHVDRTDQQGTIAYELDGRHLRRLRR